MEQPAVSVRPHPLGVRVLLDERMHRIPAFDFGPCADATKITPYPIERDERTSPVNCLELAPRKIYAPLLGGGGELRGSEERTLRKDVRQVEEIERTRTT